MAFTRDTCFFQPVLKGRSTPRRHTRYWAFCDRFPAEKTWTVSLLEKRRSPSHPTPPHRKPLATAQCQPAESNHHPRPTARTHSRRCQGREHQVCFDENPWMHWWEMPHTAASYPGLLCRYVAFEGGCRTYKMAPRPAAGPVGLSPGMGQGLPLQTRATGQMKPSVTENHVLPKHLKETKVLVTPDGNRIKWPPKPVRGLNRAWGGWPLNQPQLLCSEEAGPPWPPVITQQVWGRVKMEGSFPEACCSWTFFPNPSTLPCRWSPIFQISDPNPFSMAKASYYTFILFILPWHQVFL